MMQLLSMYRLCICIMAIYGTVTALESTGAVFNQQPNVQAAVFWRDCGMLAYHMTLSMLINLDSTYQQYNHNYTVVCIYAYHYIGA